MRTEFADELDRWDGKSVKTFHVGTTSNSLKSLGAKDTNIVWYGGKIAKIMQDHPDMTRDVIKQVPYLLEKPVAILSSKSSDSRFVFMGTLNDRSGNPVVAILELQPTSKGGQVMDFGIIASAYGKENAGNLVVNSGVVYLDKKRAKSWLQSVGLQLPSGYSGLDSIGRITYPDGKVKIESVLTFRKK